MYSIALALLSFAVAKAQLLPVDPSTTKDCRFYISYPDPFTREQGNTCYSIATYWGVTRAEFIAWNPLVGPECTNLTEGYSYCAIGPEVTTSPSSSLTVSSTSKTASSTSKTATSSTTRASKPAPTQSGLTEECKDFYYVQSGDFCADIVEKYGTFTLKDFYFWNPAVGNSCGGLQPDYYVCVGVGGTPTSRPSSPPSASPTANGPQPQQPNLTKDCKQFYQVQDGDGCAAIVSEYGTFSLSQFYSWNPDVGSSCQRLLVGYQVCVGVSDTPQSKPSPIQSGTISTCTKYVKSSPSGASCDKFSGGNHITIAQLAQWNPVLGQNGKDCATQFKNSMNYCVAVSAPDNSGLPSPIQSGTISTCSKFVKSSASGATCQKFSGGNRISIAQLAAWNPVLGKHGEDCGSQFKNSMNYCVAVSAPKPAPNNGPVQAGVPDTCITYGDALPGGLCPKFANRFGISTSDLYRWNPVLGDNGQNCQTKFLAGYWYCVEVA